LIYIYTQAIMNERLRNGLTTITTLLHIGVNIAIVAIVRTHLVNQDGYQCLMNSPYDEGIVVGNFCNYTYILISVGSAMALIIWFLQDLSFRYVVTVKTVLLSLLTAFYSGSAALLTTFGIRAYYSDVPNNDWRISVWSLAWVDVFITIMTGVIAAMYYDKDFIHKERNLPIVTTYSTT
jgi:hypothetical protein